MARDLQHVLDAVLDGVVVLDAAGRVEQLNAAGCRIFEISAATALGQPMARLLGEHSAAALLLREVLENGRTASASDVVIERRFGGDALVDLAFSPLMGAERRVDGVVLRVHDRTLQEGLRHRADEQARLAVFGRMALGIAHEVKNPLGGIRGAGELLAARASDTRTRETAELVVREADRITALLDDMMVFGRDDKLQLRPVNVHRVLDGALELLGLDTDGESCGIERQYDPSIPEFMADPDRLMQVFLNLGRNAVQAIEGGDGALRVRTRTAFDHRLGSGTGERVPAIRIEFCDTGPGIPEEIRDKVAIPFFTTKAGGTGLGIAIAQHWVAKHGGALRLRSQPGEGTTARVELPLRGAA